MTLWQARNILGDIRVYWSREYGRYFMDGSPATHKEIVREAEATWKVLSHRSKQMIDANPIGA